MRQSFILFGSFAVLCFSLIVVFILTLKIEKPDHIHEKHTHQMPRGERQ